MNVVVFFSDNKWNKLAWVDISIENRLKVLTHNFLGCRDSMIFLNDNLNAIPKKIWISVLWIHENVQKFSKLHVYVRAIIRFNIEKQKVCFLTFILEREKEKLTEEQKCCIIFIKYNFSLWIKFKLNAFNCDWNCKKKFLCYLRKIILIAVSLRGFYLECTSPQPEIAKKKKLKRWIK